MRINAPIFAVKLAISAERLKQDRWVNAVRWKNDPNETIEVSLHELDDTELTKLQAAIDKKDGYVGTSRKISSYRNIVNDKDGQRAIKRLEALETALIQVISKLPNKWLFEEQYDGQFCPVYVKSVRYSPPHDHAEAHTTMTFEHILRGSKVEETKNWDLAALKGGKTVTEILTDAGFVYESDKLKSGYEAEMQRYTEINGLTGKQYNAHGTGYHMSDSYSGREWIEMVVDGEPTKAVMDDDHSEGWTDNRSRNSDDGTTSSYEFWSKISRRKSTKRDYSDDDDDDDDSDENIVVLPTHPYVKVFDLKNHQFVKIHVAFLTDYVFDHGLIDKLVLPEEQKDLVTILIQSTVTKMEDIVRGKTGGIIVIATGDPGVGKTLTAEVCSETVERPLYPVQCSQLGTDEETVEKKLQTVLQRAARWGAILLIDEADVYIHERGDNIQQNAIVGVWLRLMEYYRGIMFMTSNRAVIIDDAILSRATAWIRYERPDKGDLCKLWVILGKQYGVNLGAGSIESLVQKFPTISGRSVKNLLKLSRLLSLAKKESIDVRLIEYCSKFLDIEKSQ